MKLVPVLTAIALLAPFSLVSAETDTKPATDTAAVEAQKWEYKLVRITYRGGNDREIAALNKELNESGAAGWELVNTVKSDTNDQLLLVFKRAK